MSLPKLLEKTAALLELQAEELDRGTNEKVAAFREDLSTRLEPALDVYERLTGEKVAQEQRDAILNDGDSPLIPILEKLAAQGEEAMGLGAPEKGTKKDQSADLEAKPIGIAPPAQSTHRRGKRRDSREIKQATIRQERDVHSRYDGE